MVVIHVFIKMAELFSSSGLGVLHELLFVEVEQVCVVAERGRTAVVCVLEELIYRLVALSRDSLARVLGC
jgi:hypothetical protein